MYPANKHPKQSVTKVLKGTHTGVVTQNTHSTTTVGADDIKVFPCFTFIHK